MRVREPAICVLVKYSTLRALLHTVYITGHCIHIVTILQEHHTVLYSLLEWCLTADKYCCSLNRKATYLNHIAEDIGRWEILVKLGSSLRN